MMYNGILIIVRNEQNMIILILSLLNWIFLENTILRLLIALVLFIIVEKKRRVGNANALMIAGQFISAFIIVLFIVTVVLALIARYTL